MTVEPPANALKDQLKRQITQAGIERSEWEDLVEDREEWRATIKSAADNFEEGRKTAAAEKRQRRKNSASQPPTDPTHVSAAQTAQEYANQEAACTATSERVDGPLPHPKRHFHHQILGIFQLHVLIKGSYKKVYR